MKNRIASVLPFTALLALAAVPPTAAQISAVPNSMNFQGRLATSSGNPVADGTYSIRFSLHDALTGGTEKYSKTVANIQVKNGTFAVTLDALPANTFHGNLWLEVKIGNDAALTPRTPLVSVPYAIKSDLALTVPDSSLTTAKFATGVLNSNVWLLGGNTGVTSGFLGTTDNNPLEFRVNGYRAVRFSYAEDTSGASPSYYYRSMNVLGGSEVNEISAGVIGATIAGGGSDSFTSVDSPNRVTAHFGTVGGGVSNRANGVYSTVSGGVNNATGDNYATIGGGNVNSAYGYSSTVPGGSWNSASGDYSFAAGRNAKANNAGTFVWADNGTSDFASTAPGQFLIRASNGVGINNTNPGRAILRVSNTSNIVGIAAGDLAPVGAASFESNRVTNTSSYHLVLCNNGTDVFYVNGSGRPYGTGSYVTLSDARYKTHVATLENALATVLNLRGVTYEWDTEKWKERGLPQGRQIGFIAQEVEKILPELVTTDKNGYKMVSYADAVPVLVEAVKTLKAQKDTEINALKAENTALKARLDALAEAVAKLQTQAK